MSDFTSISNAGSITSEQAQGLKEDFSVFVDKLSSGACADASYTEDFCSALKMPESFQSAARRLSDTPEALVDEDGG